MTLSASKTENTKTQINNIVIDSVALYVCQHCDHEWNDPNRYYCVACGGPYRIPNKLHDYFLKNNDS